MMNQSIIDQDIPPTADVDGGHRYQNNESYLTNDLNNESFSSLPAGETYHLPPDEDYENSHDNEFDDYNQENDPFDTSNVNIDSQSTLTRYNQNDKLSTKTQSMTNVNECKPSIINQLLASNDINNTLHKPASPPVIQITTEAAQNPPNTQLAATSTPEPPLLTNETTESTRHRRAVSAANSEPEFLPPLTSPFSPPAFNPYDLVLGSNEAIAGLDSPSPYNNSKNTIQPKRQTEQNPSEAFSWLNEKIGDMKISTKDQNVFQFPNADSNNLKPVTENLEPLYATVNKKSKVEKNENVSIMQQSHNDNSKNIPNVNNIANNDQQYQHLQQQQIIQAQHQQMNFNQHQMNLQQYQQMAQHQPQQMNYQQQQNYQPPQQMSLYQQQQQQQSQQMLQPTGPSQALIPFPNQYEQYNRMEKEMEMKNLEKLKQHR